MSYLKFDKEQLINLLYSLNRETLRSNRTGSYISTTLNGCNTRKYHGLLVCPISSFDEQKHVLLSSLDASVIQEEEEFKLGIHRYRGGVYEPNGHKYIQNIQYSHSPKITYRIGSIILTMERILRERKKQVLIRYILEQAPDKTTMRFKPFLAFRNMHSLSKANLFVNSKYLPAENGICTKLYDGYPELYMQFSKSNEFVPVPDWYYNIEYIKEFNRGYEYLEDLFVPGYFELSLEPGEAVVFSAGLENVRPKSLRQIFSKEVNRETHRVTFAGSLKNAAGQFIQQKKDETTIIAGFPWYDNISRQTFISLPGIALATGKTSLYNDVLGTYKKLLKNGLFPDNIFSSVKTYSSADASLWYIWALQKYAATQRSPRGIWLNYCSTVKEILEACKKGLPEFLTLTDDGLLEAVKENTALTWMNSYVKGQPVVQRAGLAVEINALWYNAVVFALEMCRSAGDRDFVSRWEHMPEKIGNAFINTFWKQGHEHLADVVYKGIADWAVRPNMIIAAAMKFSPLSKEQKKQILSVAKQKLLTKRGMRSLSPDHLRYKGIVEGGPDQREAAIHQGAAWPWLMQFFTEAYLAIHGAGGLPFIKTQIEMFEEALTEHCIGTFSEVYNGDPPHNGKGAVSQAWNVAGVYSSLHLTSSFKPLKIRL
ncbi:MAG: amylo-alpha-1,6-glucosidase [Mariniphaga sp.]